MINLHVVFTMNPSSEGLKDRAATSPALFNRCVLNWFGDWSTGALYQVGLEFTNKVDLDKSDVSITVSTSSSDVEWFEVQEEYRWVASVPIIGYKAHV